MNPENGHEDQPSTSPDKDEGRIAERLFALKGEKSLSQFAQECGLGESSMRKYLAGSMPGLDKAAQIAEKQGVELNWLAYGKGPARPTNEVSDERSAYNSIFIKFALETKENPVGYVAFRREWIEKKGINPNDLILFRLSDDSMSPTLRTGSVVAADTAQERFTGDGLYVIDHAQQLSVRRLQRSLDSGGMYIICDNKDYLDQHLTAAQAESLYIHARVIWTGCEV